MRLAPDDRRHAARIAVERSCRLRRQIAARFEHAHTLNVSTSGALLEITSHIPVSIGESLALAVAWDGAPLIRNDSFVQARVIRADSTGDTTQRVAIAFATAAAEPLAMAA
jgi:hypothetical protein